MDRTEYVALVAALRLGKRLPEAVYVHREAVPLLPARLQRLVGDAAKLAELSPEQWDIAKFSAVTPRISLLTYPSFFEVAFPALSESRSIDLVSRTASRRSYDAESNRPILHRKETLLPPDHPMAPTFSALTAQAERAGLFKDTKTIGFAKQWSELLARDGWEVVGHSLVRRRSADEPVAALGAIHRHRTAIQRPTLSTPMQALWRHGYLDRSLTVFDYGCGRGGDLHALRDQGIDAAGWDPFFAPDEPLREADVVNLGFVLNVIEDQRERRGALTKAFALARRVLVVAVLLGGATAAARHAPFGDGVLTGRNTFQKYFEQSELRDYLESTLGREPIALGPGIFFVFRSDEEEQRFLARRQAARSPTLARTIAVPRARPDEARPKIARVRTPKRSRWEEHAELAEMFWDTCLALGRVPSATEFSREEELRATLGSPATVFRRLRDRYGAPALEDARQARMRDVLVYLALNVFERRRSLGALPERERHDVKAFWGSYGEAQRVATTMLFAAGDSDRVREACSEAAAAGTGYLDREHALWLHTSLLPRLPALLRVFLGCAARLYGDVEACDLVKLHARSAKVTLMTFDDFACKSVPEMLERVKIDMRAQRIDFFSYGDAHPSPLLYMKSRYIDTATPHYDLQKEFDAKLAQLSALDFEGFGPARAEFEAALSRAGVRIRDFDLVVENAEEK